MEPSSRADRTTRPLGVQAGAEFFNLFNHPQFEGLATGIGSPTFGVITDARDPRFIQLRAKLNF